ncbi:MAG: cold shock domain-containing protein [Planctomycetota bacterium]
MSEPEESEPTRKRYRIQRRRLGRITFIDQDNDYGFIEAEDFREDVFFHTSVWEGLPDSDTGVSSAENRSTEDRRPNERNRSFDRNRPRDGGRSRDRDRSRGGHGPSDFSGSKPEVGLWVEFEINDEHFETEKRLRAKIVRPTERPMGRKLSGRDATFNIVTHHENARRKRPSWRKKDS